MSAAHGEVGSAIFERDGWFAGKKDVRLLTLRRETGPREPVAYKVRWTGNDGTFQAPDTVTLPLNDGVSLPVTITATTAGAHSALLDLLDDATGAVMFRTQAVIVAAERFAAMNRPLVIAGTVPLMEYRAHHIAIPDGVESLGVELTVTRGLLATTILRNHGLSSGYHETVDATPRRVLGPGRYSLTIPRPQQGTWTIGFGNDTARRDSALTPASFVEAQYRRLAPPARCRHRAPCRSARPTRRRRHEPGQRRRASPALDVSPGFLRSYRSAFLANGLPNEHAIDVPANCRRRHQIEQATTCQ